MALKFQFLIDSLEIKTDCPFNNCIAVNRNAVRWTFKVLDNEISFLPNILYDQHRGIDTNKQNFNDIDKCKRCGISLFNTESNAKNTFKNLNKRIREKLEFTHLATGKIQEPDGIASEISNNGHYSFFEAENSLFKSTFLILGELNN
jgi:hypothetical protein